MPSQAQIYALIDPETGEARYIGKAKDAQKRLKSHMRDSRRRDTPVYRWIRKLSDRGLTPTVEVLINSDNWQADEKAAIAKAKAEGARLLNVAEGGDEPFCPQRVRAENGRKVAASRDRRIWWLMRAIGDGLKRGYVTEATKAKLRARPDLFASVLHLL